MRIKTLKRNTSNVIRKVMEARQAKVSQINLNLNVLLRQKKDVERELHEQSDAPGATGGLHPPVPAPCFPRLPPSIHTAHLLPILSAHHSRPHHQPPLPSPTPHPRQPQLVPEHPGCKPATLPVPGISCTAPASPPAPPPAPLPAPSGTPTGEQRAAWSAGLAADERQQENRQLAEKHRVLERGIEQKSEEIAKTEAMAADVREAVCETSQSSICRRGRPSPSRLRLPARGIPARALPPCSPCPAAP